MVKDQPILFSNAEMALKRIEADKGTSTEWCRWLIRKGGLNTEEDRWLELTEWLTLQPEIITREQIASYIHTHKINILEKELYEKPELEPSFVERSSLEIFEENTEMTIKCEGGTWSIYDCYYEPLVEDYERIQDAIKEVEYYVEKLSQEMQVLSPRHKTYLTIDFENYKELVLYVPHHIGNRTVNAFDVDNWFKYGDIADGVIGWAHIGDAYDEQGNKILCIDEIMSHRHTEGKENGYRSQLDNLYKELAKNNIHKQSELDSDLVFVDNANEFLYHFDPNVKCITPNDNQKRALSNFFYSYGSIKDINKLVPDAPFEESWYKMIFKRLLRYAVDGNYSSVVWTTGELQSHRNYSIASIYQLAYYYYPNDLYTVLAYSYNENIPFFKTSKISSLELRKIWGETIYQRILSNEDEQETEGIVKGCICDSDLTVRIPEMTKFYDKILINFADNYCKKWDAKVTDIHINTLFNNPIMHSIPITNKMKESVLMGQPMFRTNQTTQEIAPIILDSILEMKSIKKDENILWLVKIKAQLPLLELKKSVLPLCDVFSVNWNHSIYGCVFGNKKDAAKFKEAISTLIELKIIHPQPITNIESHPEDNSLYKRHKI